MSDTVVQPHRSATANPKAQRVLACVLCQHRKVRCDRVFPCGGCVRAGVQCVPGSMIARPRKRRFPERELLNRIRSYETLLREHNVPFEPLHASPSNPRPTDEKQPATPCEDRSSSTASPAVSVKQEAQNAFELKSLWHAMNSVVRDADGDSDASDDDDLRETHITDALRAGFRYNNDLLFGISEAIVDLSTLHPQPIHILRLWQLYLEKVDPLFKVTHSITLQGRIIAAATNIQNIDPPLEALMFGIYCITIMSLEPDECLASFGSSKDNLLRSYWLGCQHALSNARFLQSRERDCLTALFFYLVSIGRKVHPQSVCFLAGVAMRIAQHMGIHTEASLAKCTPFEAEMRRRLWWALVLFDSRVAEIGGCLIVSHLVPTWDCKIPLNVNDSELRPEMSEPPPPSTAATEAIYAVVRAEFGDFLRHADFQLDYSCPWLKPLARDLQPATPDGLVMPALEAMLEERYLRACDPKNAVHNMTIWMTRTLVARAAMIEYLSKHRNISCSTEEQRRIALSHALKSLTSVGQIMTSPLNNRLRWIVQYYYPFPAYVHILQELKQRPFGEHADNAWAIMTESFEAVFNSFELTDNDRPLFKVLAKPVLLAWEAREAAVDANAVERSDPPRIVLHARRQLGVMEQEETQGTGPGTFPYSNLFAMGLSPNPADQQMQSGLGSMEFQLPLGSDLQLDWGTTWM